MQFSNSIANSDISHVCECVCVAYVSIYLHPIDYAEFLISERNQTRKHTYTKNRVELVRNT